MRRGIMCHNHDYPILHYLYFGGAPVSVICSRFFSTGTGKQVTHWRRMWRRLTKMVEARLIKCAINHRTAETILFLDIKGAELVCDVYSLEIENAWIHTGRPRDFHHDLTTASLARRVIFESETTTYSVLTLEFEHYLKRVQGRKGGSTKGLGYPDFRVSTKNVGDQPRTIDVERDCATIGRQAFERKIQGATYPLLIVFDKPKRGAWLYTQAVNMGTTRRIYLTEYKTLPNNIFSPAICWHPPHCDPMAITIWNQ